MVFLVFLFCIYLQGCKATYGWGGRGVYFKEIYFCFFAKPVPPPAHSKQLSRLPSQLQNGRRERFLPIIDKCHIFGDNLHKVFLFNQGNRVLLAPKTFHSLIYGCLHLLEAIIMKFSQEGVQRKENTSALAISCLNNKVVDFMLN